MGCGVGGLNIKSCQIDESCLEYLVNLENNTELVNSLKTGVSGWLVPAPLLFWINFLKKMPPNTKCDL